MDRREFLKFMAFAALSGATGRLSHANAETLHIMAVDGPHPADSIGLTLPHEHVLVDFIGADKTSRDRYDPDRVFNAVLPHLQQAKTAGVRTLVECTPAYIGRDPALLKRLSSASGLTILTNTGYYGAAGGKFIPAHAFDETADDLSARWTREWNEGIEATGVRPGFIKTGADAGPLKEINRKLITAAARTHLATGFTIASHTGDGVAAFEQLEILDHEGVDPSAFIWVHAHSESDSALHVRAAELGAWVEFDGLTDDPAVIRRHVEMVVAMRDRGALNHVLVSHDAGWYHVGEPDGGAFRPFNALFSAFIPALKDAGFTDADLRQLTTANPQKAFALRVRPKNDIAPLA